MTIYTLLTLASLASARKVVHRRHGNGISLPVEPTIVADEPTTSNTIDFSTFHPLAGGGDSSDSESPSAPTFFAQTTFPTLTGTELITITGTNTVSEDEESTETTSMEQPTSTSASTTSTESTSRTASADDVETTETDDAAPTARPGKAAAGLAALLGLAVVL